MKFLAAVILTFAVPGFAQQAITWRFDNLTRIGGAQVSTVGKPQVVETPLGKAIHFEGNGNTHLGDPEGGNPTGDALYLNAAPLSGDATYTFEVLFRPSSKGAPAQRFFHMQDNNSQSRRMFEIRIRNRQWCLDTVGIDVYHGVEQHGVTLACDAAHLHPLDRWYVATATYDGKTLRGYVDGKLQGEIAVTLKPLPPGTTSVGTRIDKRDFFTGDVYSARFTPSVLLPAKFLKVPGSASH
ncbi:MAG TPA: LamG-like jellyroll fold domain-containing protein [Edaphobacter sp.]